MSKRTYSLLVALLSLGLLCLAQLPPVIETAQAQEKNLGRVDSRLMDLYEQAVGVSAAKTAGGPFSAIDLPVRNGMVLVDAVAVDDVALLKDDLGGLGMKEAASYGRTCSGWLPISAIAELEKFTTLKFARPSLRGRNVGLVTSQGDAATQSDDVRATLGLDGSGVTVGILSDTFDDWGGGPPTTDAAADIVNGDLPVTTILDDTGGPGIDEGRAMAQLVYDVAPGVALSFHTAFNGQADFALGIEELAGCPPGSQPGCVPSPDPAQVIVDDILYYGEPMFQDGVIAQAVDVVEAAGVSYFSAAGNIDRDSYSATYDPSGVVFPIFGGEDLHDFDPGPGVDFCQSITIPAGPGGRVTILSFQWDEPFFSVSGPPGSANDLDIYFFADETCSLGGFLGIGGFAGNIGGDALELTGIAASAEAPTTFSIGLAIGKFLPGSTPDPGMIKYVAIAEGPFSIVDHDTKSGTLYGHSNAAGAEAVGAAFYGDTPAFGTTPPLVEGFSSAGRTPILFDVSGSRLATPEVRIKPGITAPDGTNTTFLFPGIDPEPDGFPNFFGTSAAAPHAAGVAALLKQADPSLDPAAVFASLRSTAVDMDDPFTPGFDVGFDLKTGFGLIDAFSAASAIDADNDGVRLVDDLCPNTLIPESAPLDGFKNNRWALADGDFVFDTQMAPGGGPDRIYTTTSTGGCSCEQIADELGLGFAHLRFGCSTSVMDQWVASIGGSLAKFGGDAAESEQQDGFELSGVYPNPFNPQAHFTLEVAESQHVTIRVYDVLGREVTTLHDGVVEAGQLETFRLTGDALPTGTYVIRAVGETFEMTRLALLMK